MNMNNEQKNTYVKKQITAALLALLKEKSLSDISVSELTSKAEIGRVSFYRNYRNKEDILKEESNRLIKEWGKLYESNPESAPETLFPSLFDFYRDHRDFYTTLYNAGMSSIMMETIVGTIQFTPETQNLEAYMKSFWAYGIYGWMLEWIKRGMQESGKELSALFQHGGRFYVLPWMAGERFSVLTEKPSFDCFIPPRFGENPRLPMRSIYADGADNPTNWYNGSTYTNLTWSKCRQLSNTENRTLCYKMAFGFETLQNGVRVGSN